MTSPTARGEDVFERRHARRAGVAPARRCSRGDAEQELRITLIGHEHPHQVLLRRVAVQAGGPQRRDERHRVRPLTRTSNTRPPCPFSESIGPAVAICPLSITTTWSQVYSTSGQQVRRQDQVHALVVRDVADELEHLVAPFRIHAVGRLVEEQQIGIVHKRLRQLDALLHAGRVRLDVTVARLAETDVVQDFVRALHRVGTRQAGELSAIGHERDGVHARECARRFPACSRSGSGSPAVNAGRRDRAPSSAPASVARTRAAT